MMQVHCNVGFMQVTSLRPKPASAESFDEYLAAWINEQRKAEGGPKRKRSAAYPVHVQDCLLRILPLGKFDIAIAF